MVSFCRLSRVQELPRPVMNIPEHTSSACQATSSFTCVGQELPVLLPGLPGSPGRPSPCHTLTYLADTKLDWGCPGTFIEPSVSGGVGAGSCTPAAFSPLSPLTETVWGVPGTAQGVPLVSQHSWHVHGPALIPSCLVTATGAVIQRTPHLLAARSHWSWSTERFSRGYVMPVRFLM